MSHELREVPSGEAPELPDGWLDLSEAALGVDILSRPGEIAFVIHMRDDELEAIGLSFDPEGARQLVASLLQAVETAHLLQAVETAQ